MPPKYRPQNRGRRAVPATLTAPTGGLNGRDSLTVMPAGDAFQLDNWFPNRTSVDTRGGSLNFATLLPGAVESIEVFTGAAGSKMLAFSAGGIYNVTAGGVAPAALLASRTSDRSTSCMFSNAGAQVMLIYTGADQPLSFDGTTLTPLTITGLTGSQNLLFAGLAFKGRVLLAQTGMLGFYYLAVGAIQGAASYFDLAQQSLRGGSLLAITSFSQESMGAGPEDYALFVTTEGEYILYAGIDPSDPNNWALVGRYYGPPPIGKKGYFKFRSDVYFMTEEGILSFTQIRQSGEEDTQNEYITSKLGKQYTDAVTYQSVHGWSGMIYPRGNALVVNLPQTSAETGQYTQFVMNTSSNAWTRYQGWDALSWALFNRRAYFGTFDGRVVLADEGFTDNGADIKAICRQAWNTFDDEQGMGESDKQFHFATFAMQADGSPSISCALNVNYENEAPTYSTPLVPGGGAVWDVATWDVDQWAGGATTQNTTIPIGKIGYIASLWMQAVSTASTIKWFATRIIFEKAKGVLVQ